MNAAKKIPPLRFKNFEGEWEEKKLGNVGGTVSGVGFPEKEQGGQTGVPFYKVSDMNNVGNEVAMTNSNNYVTDEQIKKNHWHPIVSLPAVIFAKVGAAVFLNRKRLVRTPFLMDNNTMAYLPDDSWDGAFCKMLFDTINLPSLSQGGALPSYNGKDVEELFACVPMLPEQRKVAGLSSGLDMLIESRGTALEKLQTLKKAMLEKMFPRAGAKVPEVRFEGFVDEWEERRLGEIGSPYNGLSGKCKSDFGHGDGRYVTYLNVFNNPVVGAEGCDRIEVDKSQNEVCDGDVFFTTSSETPEEVGMASVWSGSGNKTYLNSFCFGYRPKSKIITDFWAYMLRADPFRERIVVLAQGISRYNISKGKVMDLPVFLPKGAEQKKIGAYFRSLDALISARQEEVGKLKDLKKALLDRMFV